MKVVESPTATIFKYCERSEHINSQLSTFNYQLSAYALSSDFYNQKTAHKNKKLRKMRSFRKEYQSPRIFPQAFYQYSAAPCYREGTRRSISGYHANEGFLAERSRCLYTSIQMFLPGSALRIRSLRTGSKKLLNSSSSSRKLSLYLRSIMSRLLFHSL